MKDLPSYEALAFPLSLYFLAYSDVVLTVLDSYIYLKLSFYCASLPEDLLNTEKHQNQWVGCCQKLIYINFFKSLIGEISIDFASVKTTPLT